MADIDGDDRELRLLDAGDHSVVADAETPQARLRMLQWFQSLGWIWELNEVVQCDEYTALNRTIKLAEVLVERG
ncbi:MAG: hypothetical protein QM708_15860 [Propioniciclava sp.]